MERFTDGEFKASVVGAYERGERALSVQRLIRLAEVYAVPPSDLLPIDSTEKTVIDLDALSEAGYDDLVDRYLAAIHFLRRSKSADEVRQSDKAIIASLFQTRVDDTAE